MIRNVLDVERKNVPNELLYKNGARKLRFGLIVLKRTNWQIILKIKIARKLNESTAVLSKNWRKKRIFSYFARGEALGNDRERRYIRRHEIW
jgi:hypothetical protein